MQPDPAPTIVRPAMVPMPVTPTVHPTQLIPPQPKRPVGMLITVASMTTLTVVTTLGITGWIVTSRSAQAAAVKQVTETLNHIQVDSAKD